MSPVPTTGRSIRWLLRVTALAHVMLRGAPAALVAALVVGILGMHALDGHGTPAVAATAAAAAHSDDSHEAHGQAVGQPRPDHAAADPGPATGAGSEHDVGGMVMLCVVMLAAAASTVLALLAVGILRPLLPVAFRPAVARGRVLRWVRGTGPPHEWQFSVIRC